MKKSTTTTDTVQMHPSRILAIATHERELMLCILGFVVLTILDAAIMPVLVQVASGVAGGELADLLENTVPFVGYFQVASLVATLIITLALLSKANEHMHVLTGLLVAVLILVPILHDVLLPIPILIIWAIDRDARRKLKEHGVTVGMMGADLGRLRARLDEPALADVDIEPPASPRERS